MSDEEMERWWADIVLYGVHLKFSGDIAGVPWSDLTDSQRYDLRVIADNVLRIKGIDYGTQRD